MPTKITRDALESYLNCKTKAHLKLAGQQGSMSDYESLLIATRREIRKKAIAKILTRHPEHEVRRGIALTTASLRAGSSFVLDTLFEDDLLALVFDGLKRIDEPSNLGNFHYTPMLFYEGRKIGKEQKLLLEVHSLLLAGIQGRSPAYGVIWHGRECRATRVRLSRDLRKAERFLREVQEMAGEDSPPKLILNDHCQICEFRQVCHEQAIKEDNLSLLRGMSEKEIKAYGQKGIFTVNQLSYTFRYRKPRKRAKHHEHPHYHSLQARSIRTGIVHVHGVPSIPRAEIRAYLDIEGIPDRDYYYLIGVIIESGDSISHHHFWADDEAGQATVFIQFVEWLDSIPTCVVYHFGNYEAQALRKMQRRLASQCQEALGRVIARTVNVLSVVQKHVYFPTYSNSLKYIAKALGHQWTDAESCGLQSIVWREAWERDFDLALKEKLVLYNKEDCLALRALCHFLSEVESGRPGAQSNDGCPLGVVSTEDLPKPQRKWPIYGKPTFVLKDLEHASQCAYFDYQRERVYVRTDKRFKRINRRSKRLSGNNPSS
jgi:predicted RecB family nuclease